MRLIFLGMAGLVLLIGVAGILNVGLATVGERVEEFALRRAVGTPRLLLAGIVLAETLLTGLFTAAAAIGFAALALQVVGPFVGGGAEPSCGDLTFPWQAGVAGVDRRPGRRHARRADPGHPRGPHPDRHRHAGLTDGASLHLHCGRSGGARSGVRPRPRRAGGRDGRRVRAVLRHLHRQARPRRVGAGRARADRRLGAGIGRGDPGDRRGRRPPVEHVAAINARTEILGIIRPKDLAPDECSSVVSSARQPFAMQNWDWYDAMSGNWLEWTIEHPDGRRVTTVTEYGIVGKIGINDRGVGVLFNMLRHADDGGGIGVPVHIVSRRILDTASDVPGALAVCGSAAVSASTSLTIATRHTAVSVELWPGGPGHVLPAEDGLLLRTNHFLTDPAQPGDLVPLSESDSEVRYDELRAKLAGRGRELAAADVLAVLGSHDGELCCHADPEIVPELRHATLATVCLDLAEHTVTTYPGTPCQHVPA